MGSIKAIRHAVAAPGKFKLQHYLGLNNACIFTQLVQVNGQTIGLGYREEQLVAQEFDP